MKNGDGPIKYLRIELEGVRAQVAYMLSDHFDGIGEKIKLHIENTVNEDWVDKRIMHNVDELVSEAIDGISKDYALKQAITNLVACSIENAIKPKEDEPQEKEDEPQETEC